MIFQIYYFIKFLVVLFCGLVVQVSVVGIVVFDIFGFGDSVD